MTAAHCVKPKDLSWDLIGVRVGEHNLATEFDCDLDDERSCLPPVQDIEISEKIVHPQYRMDNGDILHDIGLLRLKMAVKLDDEFIKPICLPLARYLRNRDYSERWFTAAGWGNFV